MGGGKHPLNVQHQDIGGFLENAPFVIFASFHMFDYLRALFWFIWVIFMHIGVSKHDRGYIWVNFHCFPFQNVICCCFLAIFGITFHFQWRWCKNFRLKLPKKTKFVFLGSLLGPNDPFRLLPLHISWPTGHIWRNHFFSDNFMIIFEAAYSPP